MAQWIWMEYMLQLWAQSKPFKANLRPGQAKKKQPTNKQKLLSFDIKIKYFFYAGVSESDLWKQIVNRALDM